MNPSGTWRLLRAAIATMIFFVSAYPAFGTGGPLGAPSATPNSVTLTWTAPGDDGSSGTASQYDIRYSLATITEANWDLATQVVGEPTPQPAGSADSFEVTGLVPSTTYYFAIKAADEVPNWSALSNVVSRATDPENTPPAVVADLVTENPAPYSLSLRWTAPGDDGSTGTASQYDIRYSTSTITDANWDLATQVTGEPSPQAAGTIETFTVTGLAPATTYYFALKTADEVPNWSGLSNVAGGTTEPEPTTPEPPLLVSPDDGAVDLTQPIYLDWSDVGNADLYRVQVDGSSSFGSPVIDSSLTASDYNASGLNEETIYFWRVRAHNNVGWGNWSTTRNFTTRDNTNPAALANLNAAPGDNNGEVVLTWTATGDDGNSGTASQYDIRYSIAPLTAQNWTDASQVSSEPSPQPAGSAETFTIGNLDPGVNYYFAVKVADEAGNWSALSNVASTTPKDLTPPAAIDDLSADAGPAQGAITLSWTAPGDDGNNGIVSSYLLKYSKDLLTAESWDSAVTYEDYVTPLAAGQAQTTTMSDLEPGQWYYIGIKSVDDQDNYSELSNVVYGPAMTDLIANNDEGGAEPAGPSPGAVLHSSHPTLAVTNIDNQGSNVYYFEVAADSSFFDLAVVSPPVPQVGGDITKWQVDENLSSGRTYYWRARANNLGFSATSSFSIQAAAHAYPNPFNLASASEVTFSEIPEGSNLILMSVSGATVRQWSNLTSEDLSWDGTSDSGNSVASGTYLWFVEGSDLRGKIVVVR